MTAATMNKNRFELVAPLSVGSTSMVDLAYDANQKKRVALKIMSKEQTNFDHLLRGVNVQQFLNHENIGKAYDLIEINDKYVLVQEYLSRGDLIDLIDSKGHSPAHIVEFMNQIGSACKYMHKHDVVHRDLKLENICISEEGALKLIDFGDSFHVGSRPSNFYVGTIPYMAPEFINCRKDSQEFKCGVSKKCNRYELHLKAGDVWSLGIIVYALATGRFPWAVASPTEDSFKAFMYITKQKTSREYEDSVNTKIGKQFVKEYKAVPKEVRSIIKNLLRYDGHKRWSMELLVSNLNKVEAKLNQKNVLKSELSSFSMSAFKRNANKTATSSTFTLDCGQYTWEKTKSSSSFQNLADTIIASRKISRKESVETKSDSDNTKSKSTRKAFASFRSSEDLRPKGGLLGVGESNKKLNSSNSREGSQKTTLKKIFNWNHSPAVHPLPSYPDQNSYNANKSQIRKKLTNIPIGPKDQVMNMSVDFLQ